MFTAGHSYSSAIKRLFKWTDMFMKCHAVYPFCGTGPFHPGNVSSAWSSNPLYPTEKVRSVISVM
jgi:hypothetical protein